MTTHSANDILKIVQRVTDYLTEVGTFAPSKDDTNEELAQLHAAIKGWSAPRDQVPNRGLIGLLADVCQDVDGALHARVSADKSVVGDYELERTWANYSETWDNELAMAEITLAAIYDDTGEIPAPEVLDAANRVANAVINSAGIRYWKVKEGDKRGVDLRKFRERGEQTSPAGVILRRTKVIVESS